MLCMAAFPSELSLDYNPTTHSTMNQEQKPFGEQADQMQKLQEFITRLEDERLKIDAFKRELPLCMQLLNNAMEAYRRQLETYQTSQGPRLVLEEFIPLKNMSIEESEKASSLEKASWMVSAQLWSADASKQQALPSATSPLKEAVENSFTLSSKQALDAKPRCGGAFHPFSKEKSKELPPHSSTCSSRILPELALTSMDNDIEEMKSSENENGERSGRRESCSKSGGGSNISGEGSPTTQRKARRCWSPDLHRRFVNALQILGGSQVATPKQIRELMKVDGLTNDEVKSHLQKYRLHTRRPMPAPAAVAPAAPQLLVLGGIWVPPDYATSAAAAAGPALYGAHPMPGHYCPSSQVPQDYYQGPPPPALVAAQFHGHLPPLHRGVGAALYKGRQKSPESDHRSGGERSESIEEEQEGQGRDEEEEEEEEEVEVEDEKIEEKTLVALGGAKLEDSDALRHF